VAQELGTLIAAEGTLQGESGWYAGPDGSLYYFIHEKVPAANFKFGCAAGSNKLSVNRAFGPQQLDH
jgi:hypothetical protein